jgi:Protein of unknown function (DUF3558)
MFRKSGLVSYCSIAFVAVGLALAACGSPAPTTTASPPEEASPAPATEPPSSSPPTGGRDFSAINLCQLVSPEEVAALAGGTAEEDPNQQSEADFSMCWYEVDKADGVYTYYIVYVEKIELGEMALALGEAGDPVPDLGDEAYLRFEESEDQFRLIVLRRGEYAIDMAGTDSDVMIELTQLLIERLGE